MKINCLFNYRLTEKYEKSADRRTLDYTGCFFILVMRLEVRRRTYQPALTCFIPPAYFPITRRNGAQISQLSYVTQEDHSDFSWDSQSSVLYKD